MTSTLLGIALLAAQSGVGVRVDGEGFIRLVRDGRTVYTKSADLKVEGGAVSAGKGVTTMPRIQVAGAPDAITVEENGTVKGVYAGTDRTLGRLSLAIFPEDVRPVEDRGYLVSSYRPEVSAPGEGGAGKIVVKGSPQTAAALIASPAVELRLRPTTEVDADKFTVGDIAEVVASDAATKARIEAQEVSSTPALGVKYMLTMDTLRVRLLRYGSDAKEYKFSGPNLVTVTRKGQRVTGTAFVQAAIREARAEYGADTALSAEGGLDMVVPLGKVELLRGDVRTVGRTISVRLDVVVDGEKFNSRTVTLEKSDPISKLRVGQTVKVIVRSRAATVETSGRVRSIDLGAGTVTVQTDTGADLVGKATADGVIEVVI